MKLISFGIFKNLQMVWRIVERHGLYYYEAMLLTVDCGHWYTLAKSDTILPCLIGRNRDAGLSNDEE